MKRYCLSLDLRDDPELIAEYERLHRDVWPEIIESIRSSGIENMGIYRFGTRLCMIMETDDSFTFSAKAASDARNPRVMEWEDLMWRFQQAVPGAEPGEKWVLMDKIFELNRS